MFRTMISPSKYIQGPGAVGEVGQYAVEMGRHALIVGGPRALSATKETLLQSLNAAGLEGTVEAFGGEASKKEIARLVERGRAIGADLVIGVGGGKALDTAKVAARDLGTRLINIPTSIATNAAGSGISVIYTEDGVFEEYIFVPRNPDLVVADTNVLISAPAQMLVDGVGDSLASWPEADTCVKGGKSNLARGTSTSASAALSKICYETLIQYGVEAKQSVEKRAVTPAFEKVVEAVLLMAPYGFESSGLAGAHSIHNGFTALEETHHLSHGQKVAFCLVALCILEDHPESEIAELLTFLNAIGLPSTLAQLGVTATGDELEQKLLEVGKGACAPGETMENEPFAVTPEMVVRAVKAADAAGRAFQEARK